MKSIQRRGGQNRQALPNARELNRQAALSRWQKHRGQQAITK